MNLVVVLTHFFLFMGRGSISFFFQNLISFKCLSGSCQGMGPEPSLNLCMELRIPWDDNSYNSDKNSAFYLEFCKVNLGIVDG
jgi:hypothetical protein